MMHKLRKTINNNKKPEKHENYQGILRTMNGGLFTNRKND